jgi:drug/metabolite transporter (DMT)-like permease
MQSKIKLHKTMSKCQITIILFFIAAILCIFSGIYMIVNSQDFGAIILLVGFGIGAALCGACAILAVLASCQSRS